MTTNNSKQVYEIAILGRVTWNLHSLNNEGTIGNVVEPRTLKLADGTTADGVSGEMLKHIHTVKLWELEVDKTKFCPICQVLEPMRADDPDRGIRGSKMSPGQAMQTAISDCILCDLHGFLIQRPTVARKSVVEFGWAVGVPGMWQREIHTHARHSVRRGEEAEPEATGPDEVEALVETSPEGEAPSEEAVAPERPRERRQMLYNRPTRSGIYAVVSVFQPWRIGLNTVDYTYPANLDRQSRYKLALRAYEAMFLRTDGAMTSTRLPHLEGFEGALVISRINFPVPVVSPLKDDYPSELKKLVEASSNEFELKLFDDLSGFITALRELENDAPYALEMPNVGEEANG